jgi:hypothetical protein
MNGLFLLVISLVGILWMCYESIYENFWADYKSENQTIQPIMTRPNKCFSCEKQITSEYDAHLSFPTKCFDCERQSRIPYNTGKTKCFDCDTNTNLFSTFNRNSVLNKV